MSYPAYRVAVRYLLAREYDPKLVAQFVDGFRESARKFDLEVGFAAQQEPGTSMARVLNARLRGLWRWLHNYGFDVAKWVVETRAFPSGKAKAVEMAARVFMGASRPPKDAVAWWAKNKRHVDLLVDATSWPERTTPAEDTAEIPEVLTVGSFTVHNTLHLAGDDLRKTVEALEKAEREIRAASPKLAKVLYGEVFVVGQIRKSRNLAWYYYEEDTVYLRPHLRVGQGEVHNLAHELGHRYWHKFLDGSAQRAWGTNHRMLKSTRPTVRMPRVGEPINIPFKGRTEPPVVEAVEGHRGKIMLKLVGGGYVGYDQVYRALQSLEIEAKFPTPYAATSPEEHFAESFAMFALGTLPPAHRETFENIVGP